MALETQLVPVSFAHGVDTKTDPKQVIPGKLLKLQDAFFQTPKELRKRYGYTQLQTRLQGGGNISAGQALLSKYRSEMVMSDGISLYSYSTSDANWVNKGNFSPIGLSTSTVFQNANSAQTCDSAHHSSGLICYAWRDLGATGTLYAAVVDSATGQKVLVATQIYANAGYNAGQSIRVVTLGHYFIISYVAADGSLYYASLDINNAFAVSGPTSIVATSDFDVCVSGTKAYFAYNNGGTAISAKTLDTSLTLSGANTIQSGTTVATLAVFPDTSTNLMFAWATTDANPLIKIKGMDQALVTTTLATTTLQTITGVTIATIVGSCSGTLIGRVFADTKSGRRPVYYHNFNSGGLVASGTLTYNVSIASKPFYVTTPAAQCYFLVFYPSSGSLQNTYFLVDGQSASYRVVGKLAPLGAQAGANGVHAAPAVNAISASTFQVAYLSGPASTQIGVSSATITMNYPVTAAEYAGNLYVSGMQLWQYDGVSTSEAGFHLFPDSLGTTPHANGGSMADGTYSYKVVWCWFDSNGNLTRSTPSAPVSAVVAGGGGNGSVTVTFNTLTMTEKQHNASQPVFAQVYRTQAGGTTYTLTSGSNNTVLNSTTTDTLSFVDTNTDSTILGTTLLYTTGGEVGDDGPPAIETLCTFKNRLVLVPSENRSNFWYSKNAVNGYAAEFSYSFVQNDVQAGGNFNACAQMDDKLVLFKSGQPFYVTGDGPAISGASNDLTLPLAIAADVGATAQTPVVLTPDGVMFQGAKGLCLLTRGLQVEFIGADLDGIVSSQTVTSATLMAAYNQVRFTLSGGTAVVYDYFVREWLTYTNHAAVAATVFTGLYCYLKSDGTVQEEAVGTFTDNGTFYPLLIQTGWLSFAGLQGYQRVRKALILGDYKGAHTLQVQVAYDFDTTVKQTDNITASSAAPYQYRINFARQKCEAIQLTIQDSQSAGYNEGLDLSALVFEVGVKRGPFRMAPTRSFG